MRVSQVLGGRSGVRGRLSSRRQESPSEEFISESVNTSGTSCLRLATIVFTHWSKYSCCRLTSASMRLVSDSSDSEDVDESGRSIFALSALPCISGRLLAMMNMKQNICFCQGACIFKVCSNPSLLGRSMIQGWFRCKVSPPDLPFIHV